MRILIIDNYDSFTYNLYQTVGELLQSKINYSSSGERSDESRSSSRQARTINNFKIDVYRNDAITIAEVKKRNYDRIILSPGPGDPKDRAYFGVCADILTKITTTSILGVCLGMQGMAHYFGGKVVKAKNPMHGKTSKIMHTGHGIFEDLPQEIEVMRYHSLIADTKTLPDCLEITAFVEEMRSGRFSRFQGDVRRPSSLSEIRSRQQVRHPAIPARANFNAPEIGKSSAFNTIEIMGLRHKTLPIVGVQFHPESFATEGGKQILTNFLFKTL